MNRGEKWIVKLRQSSGAEDIKELTGEELHGTLGIFCGATVRRKRQREDTTSDAAGTLDAILKRPRLDLDILM
jgi:hypothetical protein